ncbi:MAG: hypothetical protein ACE5G1_00445 [bacterium]
MASLFTHAFAAFTVAKLYSFKASRARIWTLGVLCSVLPDLDVIAFGVRYG